MAEGYKFTESGARRIVDVVRTVEEFPADIIRRARDQSRIQSPILSTIAFAKAGFAVDPGSTETFQFGKGLPGEEVPDTTREIQVCNSTNGVISDGTKCIISWLMMPESKGSAWHVAKAYDFDRLKGTLVGALAPGDATKTMDGISIGKGADPRTNPTDASETITVHNVHGFESDDNALCRVEWMESEQRWEIYQVTCPA